MFHVLQQIIYEMMLMSLFLAFVSSFAITSGLSDVDSNDLHSCITSGELCGGVNDCCETLECDLNEPVARCVESIDLGNQKEEDENSGPALIEEDSIENQNNSTNTNVTSGNSKLTRIKEKIMNLFKHSEEEETTEQYDWKVIPVNGHMQTVFSLKTTPTPSPLFRIFFPVKLPSFEYSW